MSSTAVAISADKCKRDGLCAQVCPTRTFDWKKGNTAAFAPSSAHGGEGEVRSVTIVSGRDDMQCETSIHLATTGACPML